MGIVLSFIGSVVIAFICYLIAGAIPFLQPYANIIALVVFLLAFLIGYQSNWTSR